MYENVRVYTYTCMRESNRFSRSPDPEVPDVRPVYYVSRRQTRINIRICTAHIGIHLRHIIIIGVRFAKTIFFPTQSPVLKLYIYIIHPTSEWYYACIYLLVLYIMLYIHTRGLAETRWARRHWSRSEGRGWQNLEKGVLNRGRVIEFSVFIFKFRVNIWYAVRACPSAQ